MGNLMNIYDVAPRSQTTLLRYGPYRRSRRDFPAIRLIAASAIGAGLLLVYAPTALAEVRHLLAAVPAMFDHGVPTPRTSGTDDSYVTIDIAPGDISAQHP